MRYLNGKIISHYPYMNFNYKHNENQGFFSENDLPEIPIIFYNNSINFKK